MPVREGTVSVGEARLAYRMEGSGSPLLLIHAANCDLGMWDATAAALSAHYRVVRYDMRGMGRSSIGNGAYTVAGDIDALLDELGIERCTLVGASAGGYCALEYAIARPGRAAALVLVSAGLFGGGVPESDRYATDSAALAAAVASGDLDRMAEQYTRMWLDGSGQPPGRVEAATRERFRDAVRVAFQRRGEYRFPQLLAPPVDGRLGEVACPTLVVDGELDYEQLHGYAGLFAREIPGARRVTLEGSAHLPPVDCPDRFASTLLDFLREIEAPRSSDLPVAP